MPWRRPARKIVSPGRMSISLSSMKNVPCAASGIALLLSFVLIGSPRSQRLFQIIGKILEHTRQRVRRGLAEAADRGVAHQHRELVEQALVPRAHGHQLGGLLRTNAAGRALAAALVLEKLHE